VTKSRRPTTASQIASHSGRDTSARSRTVLASAFTATSSNKRPATGAWPIAPGIVKNAPFFILSDNGFFTCHECAMSKKRDCTFLYSQAPHQQLTYRTLDIDVYLNFDR
jgi:hypothetical protein